MTSRDYPWERPMPAQKNSLETVSKVEWCWGEEIKDSGREREGREGEGR